MVRGHDLVTRPEVQRAEHRVHAGGRVRDEREVVAQGTHEGAERRTRGVEEALEIPAQEADRLGF